MFFSCKSNKARSAIALTIFVGLLILGLVAMPGAKAAPSITVNPTGGPPGTVVQVYGTGYTPNGQIQTELWNGTSAYTFTADANGVLNTTVTVPPVEPGLYGFTITDVASQGTTQTQFTVTQGSASPTPTSPSSATSSPSPTATVPEFPSLIALTLFIAVSVGTFLFVRKTKADRT